MDKELTIFNALDFKLPFKYYNFCAPVKFLLLETAASKRSENASHSSVTPENMGRDNVGSFTSADRAETKPWFLTSKSEFTTEGISRVSIATSISSNVSKMSSFSVQ
ncbi:hypothetical protein TNCV_5054091 [Trichonephila clavipes]|nr:hypothetical protein TNCV_5054091 [Trichonephila clavipes]